MLKIAKAERSIKTSVLACRKVIAETVAGDPEQYTEGFLGKPNVAYCQWIQDKHKWGGGIELAILSRFGSYVPEAKT